MSSLHALQNVCIISFICGDVMGRMTLPTSQQQMTAGFISLTMEAIVRASSGKFFFVALWVSCLVFFQSMFTKMMWMPAVLCSSGSWSGPLGVLCSIASAESVKCTGCKAIVREATARAAQQRREFGNMHTHVHLHAQLLNIVLTIVFHDFISLCGRPGLGATWDAWVDYECLRQFI